LAVLNYASANNGYLPPAFVADRDGRPMHSWRVLLLPYLEQHELYAAYNFAEPWDGPNNRKLADKIGGNIFRRPEDEPGSPLTRFVAVVGEETAFPRTRSIKLDDITDGTDKTILFVEVADSDINWLEPRDLAFDRMPMRVNAPGMHAPRIGSTYPDVRIAFADTTIRRIKDDIAPKLLRALLTARGGEAIADDDL
jgi:hypothetical protein